VKVSLQPYNPEWPDDFARLRDKLAAALGDLAVRIDHIGSTSIPGIGAKDCIDIQVSIATLRRRDDLTAALERIGFTKQPYGSDHEPPGWSGDAAEWSKMVFTPPDDERLCNVHVREVGRANRRYALLFRDYLRATPHAVTAWFEMKRRLGEQYPDDSMTYGYVKDAATDVLMLAAERWAEERGWEP